MKFFFIGNPSADCGRAAARFEEVRRHARALDLDCEWQTSRSATDVTALAAEARARGFDAVIACGGDGTAHYAIQELVGSETAFGILPLGGGNDLAKALGFKQEIRTMLSAWRAGRHRHIDLARVGERHYAGVAGVGFDSNVNRYANERVQRLPGVWRYLYAVFAELARFEPLPAVVEFDDRRFSGDVMFVVVANTQNYGGGLRIAPSARVDDGLLDLVLVKRMPKLRLLGHLPAVMRGTLQPSELVEFHQVRHVRIELDGPTELYGDGESLGPLPREVEVAPRALKLLVPSDAP